MKRQFFYYILIVSLLLLVTTACSSGGASDIDAGMDIVIGSDDVSSDPGAEDLPEKNDPAPSDEPEAPPEESGTPENNDVLSFDPSSLNLGKAFSEIEKEYPDLEYSGYWSGGEYYSSPSAKKFFIFDSYEINDPDNPNKNTPTTAFCAAAKLIFPGMGSKLSVDDIAGITGNAPYVEENTGEGEDVSISFKLKGYVFWFSNSYDLLPDTIVTVRIE